jgi:hypothetical protein
LKAGMPARRRLLLLLAALALLAAGPAAAAPRTIVFPRAEQGGDRRDDYPVQLLLLALGKAAPGAYAFAPHKVFMLQERALQELQAAPGLDIVWTMTTAERERSLMPIRVPLDRGLLGWRLLLVRQDAAQRFAAVRTTDALRPLRAGQGADWPDTDILKAAGLKVETTLRYGDLFANLSAGRIDYFPRSLLEVWSEAAAHSDEGLVVETNLVLHYPTAMYFFVKRSDTTFAADLRKGLEMALADGSMQVLFERHYGSAIRRAGLGRRTVIELKNPLLPPETPLDDRRLWFRP